MAEILRHALVECVVNTFTQTFGTLLIRWSWNNNYIYRILVYTIKCKIKQAFAYTLNNTWQKLK